MMMMMMMMMMMSNRQTEQVPVVQRANNFRQWINRYPAYKMHSKGYILPASRSQRIHWMKLLAL